MLEAAIACAIHDYPFRDPEPVRTLANNAAERLAERVGGESPDDALAETMAADLRLNGDLINYDHPGNTDVIDVAERRRGLSATLAIFYLDDEQKRLAEASKAEMAQRFKPRPVVTEIAPATEFYPAEDYHQDYFRQHPLQGYCAFVVAPKISKFRQTFANRVKTAG